MKSRRWATWVIFTVCALAVLEGLGWVTWKALRLERAEARARADSAFQEVIRLALWRMESEITPILAQEAARPYFHYQAFYPAERAYTRMLQTCSPGEVLVPSPLLDSSGPYMNVHYQVSPETGLTSPQAPTGNLRDLAESQYVDSEYIVLAGSRLGELSRIIAPPAGQAGVQTGAFLGQVSLGFEQMLTADRDKLSYAIAPEARQQVDVIQPPIPQQQWVPDSSVQVLSKEYQFRQEAAQTANMAPDANRRTKGQTLAKNERVDGAAPVAASAAAPPQAPPPQTSTPQAAPAAVEAGTALREVFADVKKAAEKGGEQKSFDEAATGAPVEAAAIETQAGTRLRAARGEDPAASAPGGTPPTVDVTEVETGHFAPVWRLDPASGRPELLLRRTVSVGGADLEQGIWIDWPALRERLLSITRDVIPGADLVPVLATPAQGAPTGRMLASIPVLLIPGPAPAPVAEPLFSPAHVTLLVTWCAALGGIIAIGLVLRTSMELSDRRGRFVSAVTHELRTPLTTFRLYTGMLAGGMVPDETARREYLGTLEKESGRLAGIVENVLDYARLGGRAAPRNGVIDLDDLLGQVLPTLERAAGRCGMQLVVERGAPDPAAVRADAATVERILLNLVDNACKYAREGSDRRVHLSVRVVDRRFRGRVVEIRVRDHGPGIPRSERRRIFRAFHRAARDAHGPHAGLGLGLALSKGLARELGGDMDLSREVEDGAELRLTLPALEG